MPTKICTRCKNERVLDSFNKTKATKDGLYSWCRDCMKAWKATPEVKMRRYELDQRPEAKKNR